MRRATNIIEWVLQDLREQRKLGVPIPAETSVYVLDHSQEIQRYYDNGMCIEEIADHVCKLVSIK